MKILLDENLPRRLESFFGSHEVKTVTEMGWSGKTNGELLALLQSNGFNAFITSDKNLRFQQPLQKYQIAVVLLRANNNRLETHKQLIPKILRVLDFAQAGQVYEVSPEPGKPL